uniref:Protein ARABIDILLO 1 n=1 Tax=Aegilops tauschii TaxID=37682 RepID=M8AIS3_AEGTA
MATRPSPPALEPSLPLAFVECGGVDATVLLSHVTIGQVVFVGDEVVALGGQWYLTHWGSSHGACIIGLRGTRGDFVNPRDMPTQSLEDVHRGRMYCSALLDYEASVVTLSIQEICRLSLSKMFIGLPSLTALDVSRTDVSPGAVSRLISHSTTLRLICALNCASLEEEEAHSPAAFANSRGKLVLTINRTISKYIAADAAPLCPDTAVKDTVVFDECRSSSGKRNGVSQLITWLEWILSQSLLRIPESNPHGMNQFWLDQGAALLLTLLKSSQEDVQERAATTLATFAVIDDENTNVDPARSEAVMLEGGIPMLLDLARCSRESLQSEAAKAIANLSVNPKVAKAVADQGGIAILTNMAKSVNRLVAEEAAGGLWNLSVGEEHKVVAIAAAGGVKALVDLIFRWPAGTGVLERAAGALANLAADDKCSLEVATAGGIHALVTLARSCKVEGVLEQAARALANLAAHGDNNNNNAAVGQEPGALEALVQLTHSPSEGVRQEAAGALWNLSFDDRNRESIASAGGVQALVSLCQECLNASDGLQERAAGALWGLSVSEANSIAIGREGGVPPLIALAQSEVEDVHETAAGALWNLAFYSCNSLRIVEEGGVPVLVHLCSSSHSKMARFMAALTLAYMFDGRMDEIHKCFLRLLHPQAQQPYLRLLTHFLYKKLDILDAAELRLLDLSTRFGIPHLFFVLVQLLLCFSSLCRRVDMLCTMQPYFRKPGHPGSYGGQQPRQQLPSKRKSSHGSSFGIWSSTKQGLHHRSRRMSKQY